MHDLGTKWIALVMLVVFSNNGFAGGSNSNQPGPDIQAASKQSTTPLLLAQESRVLINTYDGLTDIHLDLGLS